MTGGGLRRLAAPAPAPVETAPLEPEPETCEMCSVLIAEVHGHVADTQDHRLLCVCRPCHLLFGPDGAGGNRYRGVGTTTTRLDDLVLDEGQWAELQIPVELAFFFRQGGDDSSYVAFYPGPSGATESTLDLADWAQILAANAKLTEVLPDVEAVLLRHHDGPQGGFTCYVTPIDRCYELVGTVRASWEGLSGGAEVWRRIDEWFESLDRASVPTRQAS